MEAGVKAGVKAGGELPPKPGEVCCVGRPQVRKRNKAQQLRLGLSMQ